jgi:hypothetical protein
MLNGVLPDLRKELLERGCLPAKNFQTGVYPMVETRGLDIAQNIHKKCRYLCLSRSCFQEVEVSEGKYAGLKQVGHRPRVVLDWGAKLAIDNLPAIWKCKELCQQFEWIMGRQPGALPCHGLFQKRIITRMDTDGLELRWGDET